ncbi:aminotransferase class IV family protein [Volucribacter amazonae]|uniref:4-amino-4-deoxychorismate lyase n=1 Tax=Volucribacter amazonae TaxID=256731 RepID=A0A9X4PCV4_9PAST|nr:aminotransferase class IV family protein [Volucribacter amazonae]MDG6895832.1 hypothetical protein [Volucribacter amazonae]
MPFPLFETIAFEQGQAQHLDYHQARYQRSLRHYYGINAEKSAVDFRQVLQLPSHCTEPLIRCRVDYNDRHIQIQYTAYQRRCFRHFLPLVVNQPLNYSLKWADRSLLQQYYAQRGDYDEVMLVQQNLITDCTIGNLVFKRQGQWFTPKSPLLAGTQRQYLLDQQRIELRDIYLHELDLFEEVRLINAMNPLD